MVLPSKSMCVRYKFIVLLYLERLWLLTAVRVGGGSDEY